MIYHEIYKMYKLDTTLLLIALKSNGLLNLSWWWVLSPPFITIAFVLPFFLFDLLKKKILKDNKKNK